MTLMMAVWLFAGSSHVLHSQSEPIVKIMAHYQNLGDVLEEFERQSGIRLLYVNSLVDSFQIFIRVADPPHRALKKILRSTPFDFIHQSSDFWVIVPRSETRDLPANLLGQVVDARSQQPIAGANVFLAELKLGSTTNARGLFELKQIPPGRHRIVVQRIGYKGLHLELQILGNSDRRVNIALELEPLLTPEIIVEDTHLTKNHNLLLSKQTLTKAQLNLPPLMNDGEIFEILHQQPGVSRRDPDDVFPHIEGGGATEVLVELDGMPIYVPTYGRNRRSIFAAPIIESLTLHRSGYGVQHGEAMSGVIELHTQHIKEIPFNTYSSTSLSGLSFSFKKHSQRIGWASIWRSGKFDNTLRFSGFQGHDFFNKLEVQFSKRKKLTLLALTSLGSFNQSNSQETARLFSQNLGLRYDYRSEHGNNFSLLVYRSALASQQQEAGIKWQMQQRLTKSVVTKFGLDFFRLGSHGTAALDSVEEFKFVRERFLHFDSFPLHAFNQKATVLSPYFGLDVVQKFWQVQMGVRIPNNLENGLLRLEPRASLIVTPLRILHFLVAAGQYHQFTDRSYASEAKSGDKSGAGEFLVKTSSAEPSRADHVRGEVSMALGHDLAFSLSFFHKKYHFNDRAYLSRINRQVWLLPLQQGTSKGTEFWLGKIVGRLQGWASYTINHETYESEGGTVFRPYFSRENIFNVSFMYYLSSRWRFKGQFFKASGYPNREWNPEQVKIDPGMSSELFAQKYLADSDNLGSLNQLSFGLAYFFSGFAKESAVNLVAVKSLEEQGVALSSEVRFWAGLNFSF